MAWIPPAQRWRANLGGRMAKALVLGGATGLLGQALTRVLKAREWEVATLGRQNGNLLDMAFLQTAIAEAQADVVFNTVAWTAVDDAEDHKEEACQLNRALPASIARCLKAQGAGFLVQFSTDFIFSGPGETAWKETDTPHPASVYASTKLEGEKAVLETLPDRSCVIRTAWLFGPGRKNFVDTILAACPPFTACQMPVALFSARAMLQCARSRV